MSSKTSLGLANSGIKLNALLRVVTERYRGGRGMAECSARMRSSRMTSVEVHVLVLVLLIHWFPVRVYQTVVVLPIL